MKRTIAGVLSACTMLSLGAGSALADYDLRLIHTNDVHDRVESVTKYNNTCSAEDDAEGKCFGGYGRLATAIRDARAEGGNVLVVDAGDQFQGSLYYSTYKGSLTAELMNLVDYDAMAVGNHEFDDGPDVLASFIKKSLTPILSANIEATTDGLNELIKPETIITVGGERIGIVGLTTPETADISSAGPNVKFNDLAQSLQSSVDRLTAQGINKIVALSHSGSYADFEYVSDVTGVDVIVGGHDHLLFSNSDDKASHPYPVVKNGADGKPVLIVQAYAYSRYLGDLNVTFDDAGVATAWSGDPIALDASIKPAEDVLAVISEASGQVDAVRTLEVGSFTAPADGSREICRKMECSMGSLVADAMLWKAGDDYQIAIQNGGGVRASIDEGTVTMGEVLTVLPFQNALATFKLSGADIVASLEHGVSLVEEGKGQFPQVAGLKFDLDLSQPAGSRVSNVMVAEGNGFVPIEAGKIYGVVSNDFMRNGGDGYALFRDNATDVYDFGPNLEQAVADYIGLNSPLTPTTKGRINLK
ncbi:bifunctional metallophosphatase/5'-nucleotidase [Thalassospira sp. ER-Se-21-Dark]|uniref:bifunctional metallophosphatase/5'-nucleotidase n=1 Tax=Thalassospira sp. ER-Se-21-Dark TaxID=2585190 RepID=UPI001B31339B|nr:bifunctional metallophosphatase/5'-nucleotidase [Thalassospira sp. ER-Se-21-Dark]MBP3126378.1 multifunctional 2',3'-cyclic-nucleotide 2'-phosphodiesterase/5'-nucleotidase/3'-nucleotidase [Thalassospira sp. ER-Se-21-Dark]